MNDNISRLPSTLSHFDDLDIWNYYALIRSLTEISSWLEDNHALYVEISQFKQHIDFLKADTILWYGQYSSPEIKTKLHKVLIDATKYHAIFESNKTDLTLRTTDIISHDDYWRLIHAVDLMYDVIVDFRLNIFEYFKKYLRVQDDVLSREEFILINNKKEIINHGKLIGDGLYDVRRYRISLEHEMHSGGKYISISYYTSTLNVYTCDNLDAYAKFIDEVYPEVNI